jgi:hypothetical protein
MLAYSSNKRPKDRDYNSHGLQKSRIPINLAERAEGDCCQP